MSEIKTVEDCPRCQWFTQHDLCGFGYDDEVHGVFEQYADESPDRVALVDECDCFMEREPHE